MPILTNELKWYRSALQSDTPPAANGGRMTLTEIVSGVKNNLFPDVSQAQRAAGVTHLRKAFIGVRNAATLTLMDPKVSIESGTPGDSYVLLYAGTQNDTADGVTGRSYGYGTLSAPAILGATSLSATAEHAAFASMTPKPFQAGDLIRIDARDTVLGTGAFEYRTIATVTFTGAAMDITLTAGLENAFSTGAKVASVLVPGDVAPGYSGVSVTGGVTYTAAGKLTVNALGTVHQVWTVTITDATSGALSVSGDLLGVVGTGAIGAAFAPLNTATGQPYFRLDPSGWGGTPANGDTLVFTTSPAAIPLWYKRVVPAGAAAISSDPVAVCIEGESS
jgi:hypothetical protein